MMNNIFSYFEGFESVDEFTAKYVVGSLVWGREIEITYIPKCDSYTAKFRSWDYNCDGDLTLEVKSEIFGKMRQIIDFLDKNIYMRKAKVYTSQRRG